MHSVKPPQKITWRISILVSFHSLACVACVGGVLMAWHNCVTDWTMAAGLPGFGSEPGVHLSCRNIVLTGQYCTHYRSRWHCLLVLGVAVLS